MICVYVLYLEQVYLHRRASHPSQSYNCTPTASYNSHSHIPDKDNTSHNSLPTIPPCTYTPPASYSSPFPCGTSSCKSLEDDNHHCKQSHLMNTYGFDKGFPCIPDNTCIPTVSRNNHEHSPAAPGTPCKSYQPNRCGIYSHRVRRNSLSLRGNHVGKSLERHDNSRLPL